LKDKGVVAVALIVLYPAVDAFRWGADVNLRVIFSIKYQARSTIAIIGLRRVLCAALEDFRQASLYMWLLEIIFENIKSLVK
jgi:hypothetical protein